MQPTTSSSLLDQAREGSAAARTQLFERYRRRLGVLIRLKLGAEWRARIDAEDLLQEVLLRAHRDLDSFSYRSPGSFFRWLSAIADHVIADAARYRQRECRNAPETRFRSESNPNGPEPADSETPSRVLVQEERVAALLQKLDELPAQYREALILAKIEGLTTEEMAAALGKSREAVALLVFRAARRLRELMDRTT